VSAVAPEDLVIGKDAQARSRVVGRRDDEATLQHADGQRGGGWNAIVGEELVQPFGLACVVAQDDRAQWISNDALELLDVAIDRLGRPQWKYDLSLFRRALDDRAKSAELLEKRVGRLEKLVTVRYVFAAAAREIDVVLSLTPRATDFGVEMRAFRDDEECVGRPERR
jgi:hypothetical protein